MNKRIFSFVVTAIVLAVPAVLWLQRDALFDYMRLRGYEPSAQIVRIADTTTMTDDTRRLFYVYHPALADRAGFNKYCGNTESTIVLGCYIQHQGIYLYNVPDERLSGVVEVTAAHEVLHAAYDRLSSSERDRIDRLTAQAAQAVTDERFKQTIENYRKKDPNIVPNELHSILATEIRDLPAELEKHYAQYFTDRLAIVKLAESYKQEFTSREERVAAIDLRLKDIKGDIDQLNAQLESQQQDLKRQHDSLQRQKSNGQIEEYNAAVPAYNASVAAFNATVNRQKSLVTEYNRLVEERNTLAVEENNLIEALDSRSTIQAE